MRHLRLVPDVTSIDFMRYTRFWLIVSLVGVIGSIGLLATRGLNLGVDFRGGTLIMAATPEEQPLSVWRDVLGDVRRLRARREWRGLSAAERRLRRG